MAYAIVQTNSGTVAVTASVSIVMGNFTAGNFIVVVAVVGSSTLSGITDTVSNTYTLAAQVNANNVDCEIWYAKNINQGTTPTVTVTAGGSVNISAIVREYSGVNLTGAFNIKSTASGSNTAANSGATGVTANTQELVIGGVASPSTTLPTVGAGYGNLATKAGTGQSCAIEDLYTTVPGAQTATFTVANNFWSCCVAAFNPAFHGPRVIRPYPFSPGLAR